MIRAGDSARICSLGGGCFDGRLVPRSIIARDQKYYLDIKNAPTQRGQKREKESIKFDGDHITEALGDLYVYKIVRAHRRWILTLVACI